MIKMWCGDQEPHIFHRPSWRDRNYPCPGYPDEMANTFVSQSAELRYALGMLTDAATDLAVYLRTFRLFIAVARRVRVLYRRTVPMAPDIYTGGQKVISSAETPPPATSPPSPSPPAGGWSNHGPA